MLMCAICRHKHVDMQRKLCFVRHDSFLIKLSRLPARARLAHGLNRQGPAMSAVGLRPPRARRAAGRDPALTYALRAQAGLARDALPLRSQDDAFLAEQSKYVGAFRSEVYRWAAFRGAKNQYSLEENQYGANMEAIQLRRLRSSARADLIRCRTVDWQGEVPLPDEPRSDAGVWGSMLAAVADHFAFPFSSDQVEQMLQGLQAGLDSFRNSYQEALMNHADIHHPVLL